MGDRKKNGARNQSLKKESFHQLNTQLSDSLTWLKELIGEKKLENRIKKASKLLTDGIKEKTSKKIKPEKKKLSKKKTRTPESE